MMIYYRECWKKIAMTGTYSVHLMYILYSDQITHYFSEKKAVPLHFRTVHDKIIVPGKLGTMTVILVHYKTYCILVLHMFSTDCPKFALVLS